MNNPFNISDERLKDLLASYETWMKSIPKEAEYPETFKEQSKKIREGFLNKETLKQLNDDELFSKIYNYSRKLEGKAYRTLPVDVIKKSIQALRHNLEYLLSSDDSPAVIAQNIIEGRNKIKNFSKAFWSPILQAQFPEVLPNWNNKTEDFLSKLGINVSTFTLSTADKYNKISKAFKYLTNLIPGHDFYTINHLMHYGTAIKEGSDLILKLQGKIISDPVAELITSYKAQIRETRLKDELYKWKLIKIYRGRPDTNAADFNEEVLSIDFKNLVYYNAVRVKKHIASRLPEEYRSCFIKLFDEKEDLTKRIKGFTADVLIVYRKVEGQQGSHHDERTTAAFLTFHDPLRYTFFKNSFYRKYCTMIGVNPKAKGEKYSHYLELVSDLIKRYISPDKELVELVNSYLEADCFDDPNKLILAQDILFQMLDKDDEEDEDQVDLEEENVDYVKSETDMKTTALNTILYGPPGTGKTYNTIDLAVKIAAPEEYSEDNHDANKIVYEKLVKTGQIVFSTFHQSMCYEDFIEGIKPLKPSEGDSFLTYDIVPGVFKQISERAQYFSNATLKAPSGTRILNESEFHDAQFYKISLGDINDPEDQDIYDYCIENNCIAIGFMYGIDMTNKTEEEIYKIAAENDLSRFSAQALCYFSLYLKSGNYFIISKGLSKVRALGKVTGEYIYKKEASIRYNHFRQVDWLIKNVEIPIEEIFAKKLSQQTIYKLNSSWIKRDFFFGFIDNDATIQNKSFVLIIDEINRGNVAQIFGELITLIEEDKRKGNKEELSSILPYSKEEFSVPRNLYIIGTMNTADRSVEALDTALRRRFSFIEMVPLYNLEEMYIEIADCKIADLLETINNRIEKLIDRDHRIGHSYFLNIKTPDNLMQVFKNKVIPLLQEYFYGNFEKMGLVLGSGFIDKLPDEKVKFAQFPADENDFNDKVIYRINTKPLNDPDEFTQAIALLMNK